MEDVVSALESALQLQVSAEASGSDVTWDVREWRGEIYEWADLRSSLLAASGPLDLGRTGITVSYEVLSYTPPSKKKALNLDNIYFFLNEGSTYF